MNEIKKDRFIVSVKVGPKGQITLPLAARKMFEINQGDTLMILGDKNKGLAIVKDEMFYKLMGDINESNRNK